MDGFVTGDVAGPGAAAWGVRTFQDENTAARFSQPHCGSEPVWPESDDHGTEATVGHVT